MSEDAAEAPKEADEVESSDESHDEMDLGADGGEVPVSQMSKGCCSVAAQSPPAATLSAKPTPIATRGARRAGAKLLLSSRWWASRALSSGCAGRRISATVRGADYIYI